MTTPTITLYPATLPAKGQANDAFDVNVNDFLDWLTLTNGPELQGLVTYTNDVANTVLATALAGDLPALTGKAGEYIRANDAEDGGEFRTTSQVRSDILSSGEISNRNLIINGGMTVSQRSTSVAGITGGNFFTCDRIYFALSSLGTWTNTQSVDAPSGYSNSFKLQCTTAKASPNANDFAFLSYSIEGQDLQRLAKGLPGAKPATLSFWVKSNVLGTYQVTFQDGDNVRNIAGTYTINSSATWEYKTITIAGDTTGTFNNDNNASLSIEWWLGGGSNFNSGAVPTAWEPQTNPDRNAGGTVNIASTIGNTFQITGVQLESGNTATSFEHRSFGLELVLCQRYFEGESNFMQAASASGSLGGTIFFTQRKRATPTIATGNQVGTVSGIASIGLGRFSWFGTPGAGSQIAFTFTADSEL
jgi:hypothetical protein